MTFMSEPAIPVSGSVLVVEDDPVQASALSTILRHEGFGVELCGTAAEATQALRESTPPDVVLLDVGLPDLSGVELVRRVRAVLELPIILLTSRRGDVDKILGLDAGADDYVTKPFNPGELLARVRTQVRRNRRVAPASTVRDESLSVGNLSIDLSTREVKRGDEPIHLTAREFNLLHVLAEARGRVLERRQILETVWGPTYFGDERMLDTYVRRLRIKVEVDPDRPQLLHTIRGVGYRLAET